MSEEALESSVEKEYDRERLIAESSAFLGVPSHVAAGALHKSKKNLTVSEAKETCKTWLGTEV